MSPAIWSVWAFRPIGICHVGDTNRHHGNSWRDASHNWSHNWSGSWRPSWRHVAGSGEDHFYAAGLHWEQKR